jgi:hypothetical protein
MTTPVSQAYADDWLGEEGLNLDPGFCITLIHGLEPREALHRLGVSDKIIQKATWAELGDQIRANDPADEYIPAAAFTLGEYAIVVEENGYRGSLPEWSEPLSKGTEAVNVYLSPSQGNQVLTILRDGQQQAYLDGDNLEDLEAIDEALWARLSELVRAASVQTAGDNEDVAEDDDYLQVDLLQVACEYLGLRPTVQDISGPVLGAPIKLVS